MKRRKFDVTISSLIICLSSCVYNDTSVTENLGDEYFYLGAANESQILLGNEENNSGIVIVPPEVIEYNFDENYIIVKSITTDNNIRETHYWIVDKRTNDSTKYLDSSSFYENLEKLNIDLKLKYRK